MNGVKVPINHYVIQDVLAAILRFQRTCHDFGVPENQFRVVATQATRSAINSHDFLRQIEEAIGSKPELLSKEKEGECGAMGIASSVDDVEGLVMDMGGGSVQMTWVSKTSDRSIQVGPTGSISLPYGAAALMLRILTTVNQRDHDAILDELVFEFRKGLKELQLPAEGLLSLYLSGGGFRGWGHFLMSMDSVQPYPIPLVNGYCVNGADLLSVSPPSPASLNTHRVSKRRASQLPAVHLVITALFHAMPSRISIKDVVFCQGGVREGLLFTILPNDIRSQHPLIAATQHYAPTSAFSLLTLVRSATPKQAPIHSAILVASINLLHTHASSPKDIRAAAALHSTTTGILSNAHGLLHHDRAMLALILCERWGGDVPPINLQFFENLQAVVGPQASWWAKYIGRVANGIAELYPAGVVHNGEEAAKSDAELADGCVHVSIRNVKDHAIMEAELWAKELRKLGKEKNWVGGKDGWGLHVDVDVFRQQVR